MLYHLQFFEHLSLSFKVSSDFQHRNWELFFPESPSLCSPRFELAHEGNLKEKKKLVFSGHSTSTYIYIYI